MKKIMLYVFCLMFFIVMIVCVGKDKFVNNFVVNLSDIEIKVNNKKIMFIIILMFIKELDDLDMSLFEFIMNNLDVVFFYVKIGEIVLIKFDN